ncbi:hypothetical protein F5146DRAFT_957392, partial [Armillaria mellea]
MITDALSMAIKHSVRNELRARFIAKNGANLARSAVGRSKRLQALARKVVQGPEATSLAGTSTSSNVHSPVAYDMDSEGPQDLLINTEIPFIGFAINSVTDEASTDVDVAMGDIDPPLPLRSRRTRMIPKRLYDYLPSANETARMSQYSELKPPTPPPHRRRHHIPSPNRELTDPTPSDTEPELDVQHFVNTAPNELGIYRQYKSLPSHDPEDSKTLAHLCDAPTFAIANDPSTTMAPLSVYGQHTSSASSFQSDVHANSPWFTPFLNATICRLMTRFYSSTTKTVEDLNRLVHDVILAPDFKMFNANSEAKRLDKTDLPFLEADGWREDVVTLKLPQTGACHLSEGEAPSLNIPGIWHRSLFDVITTAFQGPSALDFHLKGFVQMWERPDGVSERVFGEAYN